MTTHDNLVDALRAVLDHYDQTICAHESTHRGGVLWTICDDCGQKWADDESGVKFHEDPPEIAAARAALSRAQGGDHAGRD